LKPIFFTVITLFIIVTACVEEEKSAPIETENWSLRTTEAIALDSLESGKTYLSIYSQIYSQNKGRTSNLTAMVSLRNTSRTDTIYIASAEYYDTDGHLVENYIDQTVYLRPFETVEIIIDEEDITGGTGSNFLFEWYTPEDSPEPLFEGIFSSNNFQLGLSFTTQGVRIE